MTVWWEAVKWTSTTHRRIWCINGEETIPPCVFFLFPKGKHDIQHCSSRKQATCLCSPSPDWGGGGAGGNITSLCLRHPWKFLWAPRFLIYGFTTRKHHSHTQMTWNFPWLSLTVLSLISTYLIFNSRVKKKSQSAYFIFNNASWRAVSHPVSSAKSSLCVLLMHWN